MGDGRKTTQFDAIGRRLGRVVPICQGCEYGRSSVDRRPNDSVVRVGVDGCQTGFPGGSSVCQGAFQEEGFSGKGIIDGTCIMSAAFNLV